ncbi:MAG: hypothetical protein Q9164_002423 [Protoblastenia rupestris]
MSPSTNNDGTVLSDHMRRLSLSSAAATALPPSSPAGPPNTGPESLSNASPHAPAKTPLRRAPSSASIGGDQRSTTPTLHKRTSLGSLQGGSGATPPRSPVIRRTSSYLASSPNTTMSGRSSLPPPVEETPKPPVTAVSVAHDFFQKDLEVNHSGSELRGDAQTVVILQDDCYGHRYSRPRTSKAGLNTIVERPERIHASLLGLATAYVRLGGRYADGQAAPHPKRNPTSLPSIPFKIHKTARRLSLRSSAATAIHGSKWMNELSVMCDAAESKLAMGGKELSRPIENEQTNDTANAKKVKFHEGDLYLCSGSLNALEGALGGVCEAVDVVFSERGARRAFVCIRPPGHHCSADMPSGFCWLNNVHVGIGHAAMTHGLTHAAIIDFDLHHGDGSQAVTWAHNSRIATMSKNTPMSKKTSIGYFSLHDINSYPCEMGDDEKIRNASLCIENAHGQSIWNVHLQPWKTEAEFWALYEDKYLVVLTKARAFLKGHSDRLRQAPIHPTPKAAIFLSAGFDASEWESSHMQRHQVNVPTSFYARFTRDVVMMAEEEAIGVDGRVISVLEGGYSDRALMSGVLSHLSGLTLSTGMSRPFSSSYGFGHEMARRLGELDNGEPIQGISSSRKTVTDLFDPSWWSLPFLEEVEALVNPPPPAAVPKRQRNEVRPTYSSATQSYTAKIVSSPQGRRSVSGSTTPGHHPISAEPRTPSPLPPDVDWATAAHELSKLLVPSDRETKSCKPEELNAEATRARRDRQSSIGLPVDPMPIDSKRMQLREKRSKQAAAHEEEKVLPSRASRRKTIADVTLLAQGSKQSPSIPEMPNVERTTKPMRRRSSVASVSSFTTDKGSEFSMSSIAETQAGREPLTVKKAQAPASSRPEPAKAKVAKKTIPSPRMPSNSSTASNTQKAPNGIKEGPKHQDVDQLSSGMKQMSIKLTVPPREEYEARQAKSKPAPRGRTTKTTTTKAMKPTSPTKSKAKALSKAKSGTGISATTDNPVSDGAGDSRNNTPETRPEVGVKEDFVQESQLPSQAPTQKYSSAGDDSSPLDPSYSQQIAPSTQSPPFLPPQQPDPNPTTLPPLPPSSPSGIIPSSEPSTPITAKRTKQDLPVFTSTSSISFANKAAAPSSGIEPMMSAANDSANDGYKPLAPMSSNAQITAPARPGNQDRRMDLGQPLPKVEGKGSEKSIWDIPDTPQPKKL